MMKKVFVFPLAMAGRSRIVESTDWRGACRRERSLLTTFALVDKPIRTCYKYWQMLFDKLLRVFAANAMNRSCSGLCQLPIRV